MLYNIYTKASYQLYNVKSKIQIPNLPYWDTQRSCKMRNLKSQMMLPSLFVQIQKNIMSIVQIKISIGCFRPFWLIRIKGYAIFLHSCNKHRSKSLAFFPGSEKEKRNSSIGSMNTSCIDIISWCINTKLILKTNNNRRW